MAQSAAATTPEYDDAPPPLRWPAARLTNFLATLSAEARASGEWERRILRDGTWIGVRYDRSVRTTRAFRRSPTPNAEEWRRITHDLASELGIASWERHDSRHDGNPLTTWREPRTLL